MGTLTNLVDQGSTGGAWACSCPACAGTAALHDTGAGGTSPGDFARTPTDNAFAYVAQTPTQNSGGSVAPLMAGSKWSSVDGVSGKTIITYSFADPHSSVFNSPDATDFARTLKAFSDADRQTTRQVLDKIAAVCNVQFVEVADNATQCGQVRYAYSDQPTAMNFAGYAFYPSSTAIGGNVWIASSQGDAQWDFYRPDLILHETLHAVGLKHPFSGSATLGTEQDIIPNTVMSYSPVAGASSGSLSSYPGEPMAYDVAALQYLYGASSANGSDNTYDLRAYQSGFRTLWDAGGNDTLDASGIGRGVTLDLRAGGHSDIGASVTAQGMRSDGSSQSVAYNSTFTLAQGAVVENAVGSAYADRIVGNEVANRISAGGGNDTLQGGAGDDVLDGGSGIDTAVYTGSRAGFVLTHSGADYVVKDAAGTEGTDRLTGIERVKFADGALALDIDGNAGTAAKVLGLVFGTQALADAARVGSALAALDGGASAADLAQAAINTRLGAAHSHQQVSQLLVAGLLGDTSNTALIDVVTGLLDSGFVSEGVLGMVASNLPMNQDHVGLVGLAATGLAYTA
jgi:hypothetical protein